MSSHPRKKDPAPPIRPVEVDEPGCSYNPDREQHEEVVAHAVAVEVQKNIEKELCTPAVLPKRVDWQPDDDPLMLDQVPHHSSIMQCDTPVNHPCS